VLDALRQDPELAFSLTLGGGYLVGGLRRMSQPIGAVLGVLLAGLAADQRAISLTDEVTWIALYPFLLAVGFSSLAVTELPHFVALSTGRSVFKAHPGILLGICPGAGEGSPGTGRDSGRTPESLFNRTLRCDHVD